MPGATIRAPRAGRRCGSLNERRVLCRQNLLESCALKRAGGKSRPGGGVSLEGLSSGAGQRGQGCQGAGAVFHSLSKADSPASSVGSPVSQLLLRLLQECVRLCLPPNVSPAELAPRFPPSLSFLPGRSCLLKFNCC